MMSKNKPKTLSEAPEGALSGNDGKYITRLEYICIMLSRAGSQFGTTLTGTLQQPSFSSFTSVPSV